MPYNFSQLAQSVWADLGKIQQLHQFLATGGSTTTIVNTNIADRETVPEDNYCVDATAIVVRDAAGAGAAPEGEMQRIKSYAGSTNTYTVDTAFSAAPAAGDTIAIADADISLQEMLRSANLGLRELGPFTQKNISLTTVAGQTEYNLPSYIHPGNVLSVKYQANLTVGNSRWTLIPDYDVIPGVGGATGILVIPERIPDSCLLQIIFDAMHPDLTAWNSPVYVEPVLAVAAVAAHVLAWYNGSTSGGTDYWLQRENQAWDYLERQRKAHPMYREDRAVKFPAPTLLVRR